MDIRVLGHVEASHDGMALDLGPPKQRALLARLALDANRTVRVDQLLADLWEDDLPRSAPKMVQIYVSQLRKVLPADRLRREGGGYRLTLESGELDVDRLEAQRAAARAASERGDPTAAAAELARALALWRGPALGDLSEPFAERERARLEELRLGCVEDRIDADIAAGAAADVVGELEALAAEHPLRERLRGQLMLALYRAGRQAEALDAYREFSRTLDEELGLTPSAALRELEAAMLRQEPALEGASHPAPAPPSAPAPVAEVAGRAEELAALHAAFAAACDGRRGMVMVTGPAGIGKTALVDAFAGGLSDAWIGRGQCVDASTAGEAYLPFLEALRELAAQEDARAVLEAVAPSWAIHVSDDVSQEVSMHAQGTTAQRMLREAVHALEAMAGTAPVVVILEDLHWSDEATFELLSALLRRERTVRLLVVGTLQPGDGAPQPVLDEVRAQRPGAEIALAPLDAEAVAAVLSARLGGAPVPPGLAGILHERCGGNPLLARLVVDDWLAAGAVAVDGGEVRPRVDVGELATSVPSTVRASVRAQLARLPAPDREVLEVAAIAGDPFAVADVAAACGRAPDEIRLRLEALAERQHCVQRREGDRYGFVHELQRDVLPDLLGAERRASLHRRLGQHLEHEPRAADRATRIALHLIEGGDPRGAVRFLRLGADRAVARSAFGVAVRHLRRARELVEAMPDGPVRDRAELEVVTALGQALVGAEGWATPDAEPLLRRARELAERLGDNEPLLTVLIALSTLYEVRGNLVEAGTVAAAAEGLLGVGTDGDAAGSAIETYEVLACNLFHQGAFVRALEQADRGVAVFERGGVDGTYSTFPGALGGNTAVSCYDWAGLALWFLGLPDQALARARHAAELAEHPARRYSLSAALAQLAAIHQCRGELDEVRRWAEATLEAATEFGHVYRSATAQVLRGWARVHQGEAGPGIDDLVSGLSAARATGAYLDDALHLGLLADAYLALSEPAAALASADEALEVAGRERAGFYEPELHRLRAVALDRTDAPEPDVQAELDLAIATARSQGSRSLELRATCTQARLWERSGRAASGRAAVAVAYSGFTEGLDTPDLRAAATLLGRDRTPQTAS